MKEYIERESVMQAFSDFVWNSNHSDLVPAPTWNHAVEIVRDIPAADVVEVRHGRWEPDEFWRNHDIDYCVCSACQKYWIHNGDQYDFNYCPNCGAKMDKEDT